MSFLLLAFPNFQVLNLQYGLINICNTKFNEHECKSKVSLSFFTFLYSCFAFPESLSIFGYVHSQLSRRWTYTFGTESQLQVSVLPRCPFCPLRENRLYPDSFSPCQHGKATRYSMSGNVTELEQVVHTRRTSYRSG